jgi:hypothetical protein
LLKALRLRLGWVVLYGLIRATSERKDAIHRDYDGECDALYHIAVDGYSDVRWSV